MGMLMAACDRAASCGARGRAGMGGKAMVLRGPGRPRMPQKRAIEAKRSRKGTTFEMLTRVDEFLKSAKSMTL